jgi:hypothetical protein
MLTSQNGFRKVHSGLKYERVEIPKLSHCRASLGDYFQIGILGVLAGSLRTENAFGTFSPNGIRPRAPFQPSRELETTFEVEPDDAMTFVDATDLRVC